MRKECCCTQFGRDKLDSTSKFRVKVAGEQDEICSAVIGRD